MEDIDVTEAFRECICFFWLATDSAMLSIIWSLLGYAKSPGEGEKLAMSVWTYICAR